MADNLSRATRSKVMASIRFLNPTSARWAIENSSPVVSGPAGPVDERHAGIVLNVGESLEVGVAEAGASFEAVLFECQDR